MFKKIDRGFIDLILKVLDIYPKAVRKTAMDLVKSLRLPTFITLHPTGEFWGVCDLQNKFFCGHYLKMCMIADAEAYVMLDNTTRKVSDPKMPLTPVRFSL